MRPLISVIVFVYNAGRYLGRCVESVLVQTEKETKLILVNDRGADDSLPPDDALEKVLPRTCGRAWQTLMLQARVFPSGNLRERAQREAFERELEDFRRFYRPGTVAQKISKRLLARRLYRTAHFVGFAFPRMRGFFKKHKKEHVS